jgi:hypothetical protein
MAIFVGLDVHRAQITYNALDTDSGEVKTGRIRPANRATVRAFLAPLATKKTIVAVEAMTGWRFVVEECARAGIEVRLAEPAETRERQDRKRRPAGITRSRLLPAAEGAAGSKSCRADDRAQAAAPRAPHAARTRRRGDRRSRALKVAGLRARTSMIDRGQLRQNCRRHGTTARDAERLSGRTAHRGIIPYRRSSRRVPAGGASTQIRLGTRAPPRRPRPAGGCADQADKAARFLTRS